MTIAIPEVVTRVGRRFYYSLSNMRSCDRMAISGTVLITYYDERGNRVDLACLSIDFSPLGMGIYSGVSMPAGLEVSLNAGKKQSPRSAQVRYCKEHEGRFRVGLLFGTMGDNC